MYILVITLETFLFGLFSYITCLITYIYNVISCHDYCFFTI